MSDYLAEIKARVAAATPGPWSWHGYTGKLSKGVKLITPYSPRWYVMGFRRMGMQGARPVFRTQDEHGGAMESHETMVKPDHNTEFWEIDNPDAKLIANAPSDLKWLTERVDELEKNWKRQFNHDCEEPADADDTCHQCHDGADQGVFNHSTGEYE